MIPYTWGAIAIIGVATFATGYIKGVENAEQRHAETIATIERENAVAVARMQDRVKSAQARARTLAKEYARTAADIRADRNSRLAGLRIPHDCEAGAMPTLSGATRSTDDAAPDDRSDPGIPPAVTKLEADCAATTLQLIYLQDWIKQTTHEQ